MSAVEARAAEAAIWQDVEYGHYVADLPLWEYLARHAPGPVLELGAGSGRIALHLARNGHEVIAADRDPELCAELQRRADGLPLTVVTVDFEAGWPPLPSQPALAVAPLHVLQQVSSDARAGLLTALAGLLPRKGVLAAALVDEDSLEAPDAGGTGYAPVPAMHDVDGWVYSSEPLWVQIGDTELRARRLRQRVAPDGAIERSVHDDVLQRLAPETLVAEADAAGFSLIEQRPVESGPDEANSVAVILERR